MEKDMKKLSRAELIELLCRMREAVDELTEQNKQLQQRAEQAESRCSLLESLRQDEAERREEEAALRGDMRRVLEKIDSMGATIMHCGEAERRIKAADAQSAALLERAQSDADALREAAECDIAQRKEAFTRQCEELLRGQEALRRLMGND